MSKPKYDSLEWHLHKAKDSIEESLGKIAQFNLSSIVPHSLKEIRVGSYSNECEFDFQFKPSTYGILRTEDLNEKQVEKCKNLALEKAKSTREYIEKIHQENIPLIENNKLARKKIQDFMESMGIPSEGYRTIKKGRGTDTIKSKSDYWISVEKYIEINDNYNKFIISLDSFEESVEKWVKTRIGEIRKTQLEKQKADRDLLLLAKALEVQKENGFEYSSNEELVKKANEIEIQRFKKKEAFPYDDDYYVDGNLIDGFRWEACNDDN